VDEQMMNLLKALILVLLGCMFIAIGTNWWIGVGVFISFLAVTYIFEIYTNT
jgi:hypothetical protein